MAVPGAEQEPTARSRAVDETNIIEVPPGIDLREWYAQRCEEIRSAFEADHDGQAALRARTAAVDALVRRMWNQFMAPHPEAASGFTIVAVGGYGRGWLFPHSDIDLLFLFRQPPEKELRDEIRAFCQEMWDARLRVSPTTHTLADCDHFHAENVEFTIALLDSRFLAGDRALFDEIHDQLIPRLASREAQELVQRLTEINGARHAKFSSTVFHLEPNVKDGPGGLRDYNVACWLTLIASFGKFRKWMDPRDQFPARLQRDCAKALGFLATVRCFLHYRNGRDENVLSWDAQEEAAVLQLGTRSAPISDAAGWMRRYFREARPVFRLTSQVLDEVPAARSSLFQTFQSWRTRVSNPDFAAVRERVYLQQPTAIVNPDMLMRAFEFVAQHGMALAGTTEERIETALPTLAKANVSGREWWQYLQVIFQRPNAAMALRSMHHLGVLTLILPNFQYIDALVMRDLYHRYTVDEHTFYAIGSLHQLQDGQADTERHFAELFKELQQPELLLLALLLHDLGKGVPGDSHVEGSLRLAKGMLEKLELSDTDSETVLFLIGAHLEMSAALRRDIFDVQSLKAFARKVGTTERLKMLCLETYADIKAVNPDAMTPWKADSLWRLYMAAFNVLNHSLDAERIRSDAEDEQVARVRALAPRLGRRLKTFLDGLPQRYLSLHSTQDIMQHIEMASDLANHPVQTKLRRNGSLFELTLVTSDKPMIFANVAGALSAWGMNIAKADVFSNSSGVVVDRFLFSDRYRTLELNAQEWARLQRVVEDVINGRVTVDKLMQRRRVDRSKPKIEVPTVVNFDDESSPHSTLVEVVTQDRPGLLHIIAKRFALLKCNLEVAIIDTQGQMATDVFYLTSKGKKLTETDHQKLKKAIEEELQETQA